MVDDAQSDRAGEHKLDKDKAEKAGQKAQEGKALILKDSP